MKKAYIFPGQGSQFPGMAKDLYDGNSIARDMLEQANEILGFRITDIMFDGTAEDLKATKVTQPAIFLHSVALAATMEDFTPDMVAGHSLGEFSALAAAKAIRFEDALRLVAIRAREMQKCCEMVPGTMAAILGLDNLTVEMLCAGCDGLVLPANYNCDGQVVISGEKEAVEQACAKAKESGAKRALPLPVSGAFHSPLMEPARVELAKAIEQTENKEPLRQSIEHLLATPTVLLGSHYEVSLTNSNPILHPSRLYTLWKDWHEGVVYPSRTFFYKEWTDEASELLIAMDREFFQLLRVLPVREGSIPTILDYYESTDAPSLTRKLRSIPFCRR